MNFSLENHQIIPLHFDPLSFDDFLLYGVLNNQSIDVDFFSLTNSMDSIHGLKINLGVPVRVKYNNSIGYSEIDAESSGPSAQQKDKIVLVWIGEIFYLIFSVLEICAAVNSTVIPFSKVEVVL